MKALYRECRLCGSPRRAMTMFFSQVGLGPDVAFKFGTCSNRACKSNIPLPAIVAGSGEHMTRPNPCGDPACACSGKPWWFPGQILSQHLDTPC